MIAVQWGEELAALIVRPELGRVAPRQVQRIRSVTLSPA